MQEVLYYPSFFIEDEKWLKFALLYLGEVITIKPHNVEVELNPTNLLIMDETNLFSNQAPSQEEIDLVANNYSDFIIRVLNNPILQRDSQRLKNRENMIYEIYSGKMSWKLEGMLLDYGLAEQSINGVIVHKELALEYMSMLANIIASNRNMPTITDKKISIKYRALNQVINKEVQGARSIKTLVNEMEIFLPRDLKNISLQQIIDFRNNPRNQRDLEELHKALNKFNSLNDLTSESEMLDAKKELFEMKRKYRAQLSGSFLVGSGSILGMYQLYQGDASILEYISELLGLDVFGGVSIAYGNLNDYVTTSRATSYISNVENLGRCNRRINNPMNRHYIR
ncbi:hypothetical protein CEW92_12605 [Bacillaceae bacterium SAS-127]|nr:hypothetical protein CEW92_12605 [Bacillaceae bacterium SAS-127]